MSFSDLLARCAQAVLAPIGLELRLRKEPRACLRGALRHLASLGFQPASVIDVGAAAGTWELYETFPKARHILIEPIEEYRPSLERVTARYANAEWIRAAAAAQTGTIRLNIHADLVGSSIYREREESDVNGVPRTVPTLALDDLIATRNLVAPVLLKVDAQGAELDILKGAERLLPLCEWVVLEVSLLPFFENGPQMHDVVVFMKDKGFVAYEVLGLEYRPLDGALGQVDLAFVKETGRFRERVGYATRAQRAAHNARLDADNKRLGFSGRPDS